MRHQREIGAIASFEEESESGNEPKHGRFVLWVEGTDGDEEGTGDDAEKVNPKLLDPDIGELSVEEIRNDTAKRAGDDVKETELLQSVSYAVVSRD